MMLKRSKSNNSTTIKRMKRNQRGRGRGVMINKSKRIIR